MRLNYDLVLEKNCFGPLIIKKTWETIFFSHIFFYPLDLQNFITELPKAINMIYKYIEESFCIMLKRPAEHIIHWKH